MTVRELIDKLLNFDPELPVVCGANGYDSSDHPDPDPEVFEDVETIYPKRLPKAVVL